MRSVHCPLQVTAPSLRGVIPTRAPELCLLQATPPLCQAGVSGCREEGACGPRGHGLTTVLCCKVGAYAQRHAVGFRAPWMAGSPRPCKPTPRTHVHASQDQPLRLWGREGSVCQLDTKWLSFLQRRYSWGLSVWPVGRFGSAEARSALLRGAAPLRPHGSCVRAQGGCTATARQVVPTRPRLQHSPQGAATCMCHLRSLHISPLPGR